MSARQQPSQRDGYNARNLLWVKRINSESLQDATRHGRPWTGPELEIAARTDLTARQVAAMLGRTLYAVQFIRRRLRIDPKTITLAGQTRRR